MCYLLVFIITHPPPTHTHTLHPLHIQAYRLEPLINPIYAQIKPVRIDSGSKISKDAIDHAEGTRAKPQLQTSQGKSWFSSLALFASNTASKTMRSSPEPARAKSIDKVISSGGGVGMASIPARFSLSIWSGIINVRTGRLKLSSI